MAYSWALIVDKSAHGAVTESTNESIRVTLTAFCRDDRTVGGWVVGAEIDRL